MLLNYRENDCLDTSWYEYTTGWGERLTEDHKKEKRQQLKASHDKLVEKVVISGGRRSRLLAHGHPANFVERRHTDFGRGL